MDIFDQDNFWTLLDHLGCTSDIVIDRKKGTQHPNWPERIYPVDYGYLKDTVSMDKSGIDVWVGTRGDKKIDAVMCMVDIYKRDSEIKILIGCTDEEKGSIYTFQNNTNGMKGVMIHRN